MASQSTQPPSTNPAPQELTNNDLALLLNTLNPVALKCHNLGLLTVTCTIQSTCYYAHKFFKMLESCAS